MPQGWDFVVLGGQKFYFSKHGHLGYQIKGDDTYNSQEEKKYTRVKLVPWGGVKRSNIIIFL